MKIIAIIKRVLIKRFKPWLVLLFLFSAGNIFLVEASRLELIPDIEQELSYLQLTKNVSESNDEKKKSNIRVEQVAPEWLVNRVFKDGALNVHDMELAEGSVFIGASHVTVRGMDIQNGTIKMTGIGSMDDPGIYLIQDVQTAHSDLRYVVCRSCQLKDKQSNQSIDFDGIIFSKPDITYEDIAKLRYSQSNLNQPYYKFKDDGKLIVAQVHSVNLLPSSPSYLRSRGYSDYIKMPVHTKLYEKAKQGDEDALYIYGLYWQETSWLDFSNKSNRLQTTHDLYTLSALKNNTDAISMIGSLYKELGMHEEAIKAFEVTVQAEHPLALYKLGLMKVNGLGTEVDKSEAFKLFERSAKQGFAAAQFDYGLMLYRGEKVKQDKERGEKYIALSAASNTQFAFEFFQKCGVSQLPKVVDGKLEYQSCPEIY